MMKIAGSGDMDPRIRIHTKRSWIRSATLQTGVNYLQRPQRRLQAVQERSCHRKMKVKSQRGKNMVKVSFPCILTVKQT
jgi:hypothetical protein